MKSAACCNWAEPPVACCRALRTRPSLAPENRLRANVWSCGDQLLFPRRWCSLGAKYRRITWYQQLNIAMLTLQQCSKWIVPSTICIVLSLSTHCLFEYGWFAWFILIHPVSLYYFLVLLAAHSNRTFEELLPEPCVNPPPMKPALRCILNFWTWARWLSCV